MSPEDEQATQGNEDFAAHERRRMQHTNLGCVFLLIYLTACFTTAMLMQILDLQSWKIQMATIILSLGFFWFINWRDEHSVQHKTIWLLQFATVVAIIILSIGRLIFLA